MTPPSLCHVPIPILPSIFRFESQCLQPLVFRWLFFFTQFISTLPPHGRSGKKGMQVFRNETSGPSAGCQGATGKGRALISSSRFLAVLSMRSCHVSEWQPCPLAGATPAIPRRPHSYHDIDTLSFLSNWSSFAILFLWGMEGK